MVLTGLIGEKLVLEKLRLEIKHITWDALLNTRNVKDYDISGIRDDKKVKIQVKSIQKGNWSLNIKKFVNFDDKKLNDRKEQWILNINETLKDCVDYFVFVSFKGYKEEEPQHNKSKKLFCIKVNYDNVDFYIIKTKELQILLKKDYNKWLNGLKKPHIRPKNPLTFHSGLSEEDLEKYKERWEII